jgi:hypothetical protein
MSLDDKKAKNFFNTKIKKSEIESIKAKKIAEAVTRHIEKSKNKLDDKLLDIMKDVPDRLN